MKYPFVPKFNLRDNNILRLVQWKWLNSFVTLSVMAQVNIKVSDGTGVRESSKQWMESAMNGPLCDKTSFD